MIIKGSLWMAGLLLPGVLCARKYETPNIVFILADDLGYGDLACLNKAGKIKTPNLDRLAKMGVVFTDAHSSSAVSTPTRYGVLTGRYNWRSTLKKGVLGCYGTPLIPAHRTTMASMLKEKGYYTACFGKWHLGMNFQTTDGKRPVDKAEGCNIDFSRPIIGGPVDVGFDYFFGMDAPNYAPYCFIENRHTVRIPSVYHPIDTKLDCRGGIGMPGWDKTRVLPCLQEKVVEFIEQRAKEEAPFFLYFPLTSPHTPIVPTNEFVGRSQLNRYADFVMQTDAVVGEVIRALEKSGELEHTILVFTSDNGCSPQANFARLVSQGHDPSFLFRGMKSDLFEGGHHVPCIVHWPGRKPGTVAQTVCLVDFMATFANVVGYKLADAEAEDSYSLVPLFKKVGSKKIIREATVHHSIDGSFAIRQGKWKLLLASYSGGWSEPKKMVAGALEYQLYDLEKDPEEKVNLYASHPEIAERLEKLLVKYIKEGRSTPGKPQQNDGEYPWKQLSWMKE